MGPDATADRGYLYEGFDETGEHGVCTVGARFELGVILRSKQEWMVDALYDFDEAIVGVHTDGTDAPLLVIGNIIAICLIAVAMALDNIGCAI